MWPFRPHHAHRWISVPTTILRGTYRGAEVIWMKDQCGGRFLDALVFVRDDEEPEVYTPYRYWRAGR